MSTQLGLLFLAFFVSMFITATFGEIIYVNKNMGEEFLATYGVILVIYTLKRLKGLLKGA
jgi:hypothetical protein